MDTVFIKMIINTIFFCFVMGAALTEAPDDADACFRVASVDGMVECNVRTLSSDRDVVGSMHSDGTERLTIRCSQLLFESTLRDHHFGKMQGLAEISIHNCKILRLPGNVFEGLRGLKSLKIRSMNNEWGINKELDFTLGAFNGLRELHTLDLAYNNIRKIPSDLFCALENIISLNLTHNKIKFVDELGFGHKCGSTLQRIDLSFNDIMSLPADSEILHLRRLTQLFLQNNKISELPTEVFSDLLSLKVVNISDNAINYLPEGLFHNTREIREIYMQNNELEILPKRIFNRLEQLLVLDLSANKLKSDHIEDETFSGLIRLIVLDLSHNVLTRITRNIFKDLFCLQILSLNNNSIGYVEDNAFSPLYNLHTLNLGQNMLHAVEDHMFNGLFILNKLNVNNNLLSFVSVNAFKNCSDLKELDLSSNKLTKIPEAILQLPFLKSLDLGENLLTEITNNSFQNLSQLTGLRLIDNQIGNLTAGMFWALPGLQVLNLAKNKIQSIETETFQKNTQLEAVRLDGNFVSDINGVFVALTKLLWLNLSENHLVWFDYAFIPGNLKWLDIHANFIEILGNYYKIQKELHIKTLDVSHNRLATISPMSIPNSVELLFINNNLISSVETDTFLEKRNLTRVDMYANEIESLDINSLRISRVSEDRTLPEFYISGNPFRCDCNMKWLLLINSITSRQYPRVMDLENVICKESYVRGVKYLSVTSLHLKDFLCKYETYCPDNCECCDLNDCDCKTYCPTNCSCYHDSSKSTSVVDCSVQQLKVVPTAFPIDATHIYLDGNVYSELGETFFDSMRNAYVIYLNASNVIIIRNNTFSQLRDLRILHLDNNKLKQLRGLEFSKLSSLKELYLQSNLIEYISNETFSQLGALEVLRLDGNRLVNYGLWHLDNNKKLQTLFIGNNNWSCDCKYLQGFLTYVSQNIEKVLDIHSLWCVNEKLKPVKKPLNLNITVCSEISENSMMSAFFVSHNLPLLASAITGFMLILLILALIFTFRYACRMWLYSNCGIKLSPLAFKDTDKLYDAYVCYSPKDEEFVIETLARELENGYPSYHLCLHYRDVPHFEATYAQFPDLVVEATEASRRIIVVLTNNFITTEWSQIEFRQALQKALRKNPNKLIIVAVGPVPRDPELKSYFKTGLEITWKEKRFWERLRYAMPSSKRHGHKLKRLNYGRNSNTYTMDASVLNSTCQTLCGKSANSAERSPCDRPLSEHIYSTIDSDYSSTDFQGRHNQPQSVVFQHTVQTYLV
ncbi:toll-like receptor 7 isoform X2 [Bombyx mandarina]|uniref:Toll-like receptor 7 isoform X1 n=1 Tax=Bombyx mandarina TaxID=7092 RepID=A0A6J2K834_BOMMA|nr:toll-like receptor 7 isoform X1 [Bombyx mandarina]XP_028036445.1 toll-like receptor 7 isoform X2 [Bombyx mandarina]